MDSVQQLQQSYTAPWCLVNVNICTQWGLNATSLQSNAVSHWLGANLASALHNVFQRWLTADNDSAVQHGCFFRETPSIPVFVYVSA